MSTSKRVLLGAAIAVQLGVVSSLGIIAIHTLQPGPRSAAVTQCEAEARHSRAAGSRSMEAAWMIEADKAATTGVCSDETPRETRDAIAASVLPGETVPALRSPAA